MPDPTPRVPDPPGDRREAATSPGDVGAHRTGRGDEPEAGQASPTVSPEALRALASPTLAALYASQGHGEMAAAIYAQLDPRGGGSAGASDAHRRTAALLLDQLLALRQAARRRREAAEAAAPRTGSEDGTHGR